MTRILLAFFTLMFGLDVAARSESPRIAIGVVSVGLPPGMQPAGQPEPFHSVIRFATWAPLYFELEVKQPIDEAGELVIETPDGDEVKTTLTVPLPSLATARTLTMRDLPVKPYVRIAGGASETILRVRTTSGVDLAEPYRIRHLAPTSARTYVVLSLGTTLPGFDLPKESAADAAIHYRNGRVETAAITDFEDLPERWFGYDAADLVVLATGTAPREFLGRLFDPASEGDRCKLAALQEWVRRGGRLMISAGANISHLARCVAFREMLPFALAVEDPSQGVPGLFFRWKSTGGAPQSANLVAGEAALPVANLIPRPDRPARILLEDRPSGDTISRPIAVQSAYGLGRISFLAWDLDLPPFTSYKLRPEFWDWVLRECGSPMASAGAEGKTPSTMAPTEEDELAAALRTHLDTFADVPVVSFGWIAFFLALYIAIIGPLEYLLLKRVLGRLELTWLTFPVIVLSVCAAAYFCAFALKGNALRVNKLDVIEVDPASGRLYGQSWYTVFSPRSETYTVTVSPAAGWTGEPAPKTADGTLTSWLSSDRGGRASLLRHGYRYDVAADGSRFADALEDVPVQVWSTKSFSSRWSAPLDAKSPVIESQLTHPPSDPSAVVGTIVNRMPLGEIEDVVAIYAGQAYTTALETLAPGTPRQLVLRDKTNSAWMAADIEATDRLLGVDIHRPGRAYSVNPGESAMTDFPMRRLLFHESSTRKDQGVILTNASLRHLDQSWRLSPDNRSEVIVIGRVARTTGPAEEALGERYSPTQLWLKEMPGDGRTRTPLTGAGRQETFIRLYLPVK